LSISFTKRKSSETEPFTPLGYISKDDDSESSARKRCRQQSTKSVQSERSAILRLRKDPSVTALLNMYDDRGHLDDQAFGSPEVGRVQRQRMESTLSELLGEDFNLGADATNEGDIESWTERLLGLVGMITSATYLSTCFLQ
jgi:hypothetical protein